MEATLVAKLIEAHRRGREDDFLRAANGLVRALRESGDAASAARLEKALQTGDSAGEISFSRLEPLAPGAGAGLSGTLNQLVISEPSAAASVGSLEYPSNDLEQLALPPALAARVHRIALELRNANKLRAWGMEGTARAIFCGPPGTGKTLAARSIASMAGRPLLVIHLEAVLSSFLGETGKNLAHAFSEAGRTGAILFLDEIDAIAKGRNDPHELGEMKRVVNAVIQTLDRTAGSVPVMAATNHEELLDDAIWRRFSDVLRFPLPDASARERIAKLHLSRVPQLAQDASAERIAQATSGFSGADVVNVVRNAIRHAILRNSPELTWQDAVVALEEQRNNQAGPSGAPSMEHIGEILQLRERGYTQRQIAKELGLSAATVNRRLRGSGFAERGD